MAKIKDKVKRKNRNISHELIASVVVRYFDTTHEELFFSRLNKEMIPGRRIAFYLMRTLSGIGISNIATAYNHDKNLVMRDTLLVLKLMKTNKEFNAQYKEIKAKVFLKTNGLRKNVPSYPSHYGLKKLIKERNI
jgi:chromosomal replication initiation ATPase DnaA